MFPDERFSIEVGVGPDDQSLGDRLINSLKEICSNHQSQLVTTALYIGMFWHTAAAIRFNSKYIFRIHFYDEDKTGYLCCVEDTYCYGMKITYLASDNPEITGEEFSEMVPAFLKLCLEIESMFKGKKLSSDDVSWVFDDYLETGYG